MWTPNDKVWSPKWENEESNFWHTYNLRAASRGSGDHMQFAFNKENLFHSTLTRPLLVMEMTLVVDFSGFRRCGNYRKTVPTEPCHLEDCSFADPPASSVTLPPPCSGMALNIALSFTSWVSGILEFSDPALRVISSRGR